jgi:hypothetical protein
MDPISATNSLLLILLLITLYGIVSAKADCLAYGCSRKAVDVASNGPENDALSILRHGSTGGDVDDDSSIRLREEALSILQTTGDASAVTLTLQGYKGPNPNQNVNQDRSLLISPFHIPTTAPTSSYSQEQKQDDNSLRAQLIGVFDGHGDGGEKSSQHALEEVPKRLADKLAAIAGDSVHSLLEKDEAVKESLKQVFLEVNHTDPTNGEAGCTATVVLQLGPKIFIANAGDSVSFVGVYFGTAGGKRSTSANGKERPMREKIRIIYETREDKPDLPDEMERIIAAGGYVNIPKDPNEDVPRAYHVDKDGKRLWGLAMSRSLGDWSIQGVIAEPIVDVLNVRDIVEAALETNTNTCPSDGAGDKGEYCEALDPRDVHIFAVSATDGMMDELPSSYIGSILATALFDTETDVHPISAAEYLILESAKGWDRLYKGSYRDDIAISAVTILSDESIIFQSKSR